MKIKKFILSIFIFLIFFVWATKFNVLQPFKVFFPSFHIYLLISSIFAVLTYLTVDNTKFDWKISDRLFFIIPVGSFLISLTISFVFFQGMPHIQDSVDYLVMAQNFAKGHMHNRMPEHYEFFKFLYMIPDGESFYSMFLPGFSFFLVPFVIAGVPFLANPFLTALNVYLAGRIASRLFDDKVAVISMVLMLLSSFLIVMGGTFMAHPFCAAMTLSAIYFYILSSGRSDWKFPMITGGAIGWLMLIRPQNAVFLAVPLACHSLFNIRKEHVLKNGLKVLAAFFPFLVFLLFYNWLYTGNIFVFKQDIYFNYSEPATLCHRFGMGTGCPYSNWIEMPKEGLTWVHALLVSYRRLSPLIMNLLLHPLSFVFVIIAFVTAQTKKDFNSLAALFAMFMATFTGYFFFYFDGNVFGPRYYYETSFLLIIIMAYGLCQTKKIYRAAAFSFLFAGMMFQLTVIFPELYQSFEKGFWDIDAKLGNAVKKYEITNAIVFVSPKHLYGSGFALMDHSDIENNDVIYVRDLGPKQNKRMMFDYPDRMFYLATFQKNTNNTEFPVITELEKVADNGEIHVEMEDKSYPLTGVPDYCNVFPEKSFLDKYFEIDPPYKFLVFDQWLFFCRFTTLEQYYDFGQKFNNTGKYEMKVKALSGPEMGNFKLFIDDKFAGFLKFNSKEDDIRWFSADISVQKGFRKIKLQPENLSSRLNYFFIDYIDFVPRR